MKNVGDKLHSYLYANDIAICTAANITVNDKIYYDIEDIVFSTQFEVYDIIEIYLNNYEKS